MHRLVATLAAFAFLASASAAFGAGPSYVPEGGLGVLAHDGKTRYVAVPTGNRTAIVRVSLSGGRVVEWADLAGSWGIPQLSYYTKGGEGLSRDGSRLVLGMSFAGTPSQVHDPRHAQPAGRRPGHAPRRLRLRRPFAGRVHARPDRTRRREQRGPLRRSRERPAESHLRPGRIADKTQPGWVMEGSAVTRATSGTVRWVYTLFTQAGRLPVRPRARHGERHRALHRAALARRSGAADERELVLADGGARSRCA